MKELQHNSIWGHLFAALKTLAVREDSVEVALEELELGRFDFLESPVEQATTAVRRMFLAERHDIKVARGDAFDCVAFDAGLKELAPEENLRRLDECVVAIDEQLYALFHHGCRHWRGRPLNQGDSSMPSPCRLLY